MVKPRGISAPPSFKASVPNMGRLNTGSMSGIDISGTRLSSGSVPTLGDVKARVSGPSTKGVDVGTLKTPDAPGTKAAGVDGAKAPEASRTRAQKAKGVFKKAAMLGAAVGGVAWIKNNMDETEELKKECVAVCLPNNWDNVVQGVDDSLDYKLIDDPEFDDLDEEEKQDIILCKDPNTECGEYCMEQCEEKYDSIIEDLAGGIGSGAKDIFEGIAKGLGLEGMGSVIMWGLIGIVAVVILIIIMTSLK